MQVKQYTVDCWMTIKESTECEAFFFALVRQLIIIISKRLAAGDSCNFTRQFLICIEKKKTKQTKTENDDHVRIVI